MGSMSSNLEASKYGYDLVCATTQDSINATMKAFIGTYQAVEFTACYVYDPKTKTKILMPLEQIIAAIGCDPFSIPDKADPDTPALQKLYNDLKFVFGFRAKMGLPSGVQPAKLPDIVVLDKGNSRVSYQMYCAEFSVIELENDFGSMNFHNLQQPPTNPWLFQFEVNLDMRTGDQNAFNNLPKEVQDRIKNLNPDSMFSVQQLYLDLNSAGLQQMPSIAGLDPTTDAYVYLTRTFINQYWANLPSSGIVLGYTVQPSIPNPQSGNPSIIPTDLNIEVSPYLDANGNATTDYGMYTLNYLVMSNGTAMPPPVQFGWNWVEESEKADFEGTMTIRRNIFSDFLRRQIKPSASQLSVDTTISMTHSGENFTTTLSAPLSQNPAAWTMTPAGTAAGADGFSPLLTIGYNHDSYDSSEDALHLSSINGNFNYAMNGSVAVKGSVIRVSLHSVVYAEFNAHIMGIPAANMQANIVDYSSVVDYTLGIDAYGRLVASEGTPNNTDNGQDIDVSTWDRLIGLGDVAGMIRSMRSNMNSWIASSTNGYENMIEDMLNNSSSFVYPGGQTFLFKQVVFSDYQDLLTHVTYVDPSATPQQRQADLLQAPAEQTAAPMAAQMAEQ
jgi:hypothetical protein